MAENFSGRDVALDIIVGTQSNVLSVPLSIAQAEIVAAFQAAGNDAAALSSRLGVSIGFLSVTATKIVTQYGYDAVKITIAVNSGDPVAVLSEVAGAAAALITAPAAGLGWELLGSALFTPAVGVVVGPVGGLITGAVVGEATKVSVTNYLNNNLVGEWGNASVGPIDMSMKLTTGMPSPGTATGLPPANLAPYSQLVFDPVTQQAKLVFNLSPSLTTDSNVANGPNTYIVQPGDSLWKIAMTNGWDWTALKDANPQLSDPNFIRPAQVINGLPPVSATNTISISNPYVTSQTSATNPTDPTNVSGVESGQIAPGISMDPSVVNGPVSYASAEKGAIAGQYYMPGGNRLSPTLQQDAQLLTWGDVFQATSAGNGGSSLLPVDPVVGAYSNALNLQSFGIDPLILDLNGDGVKLTSYQEHLVLFDVDHDGGSKEQTGWVAANTITTGTPPAINTDGIVVQDLNSNGVIDNISETLSEYFNGTVGTNGDPGTKPFVNGFEALASSSLNTVADGVFNSSDAGWSTVRVWVDDNADGLSFKDLNGNGTYQPGTDTSELKTFAELGITSINLNFTTQSGLVNGGNEILATGNFVMGGLTREAQAANFLANPDGHTFLAQPNGGNSGTKIVTQGETGGTSSYVSHAATGEVMNAATLGVNNLYGSVGNDTLIGDANGNWLAGGVGSDTFDAGAGDDVLMIDASDLQANIHAGAGHSIVQLSMKKRRTTSPSLCLPLAA